MPQYKFISVVKRSRWCKISRLPWLNSLAPGMFEWKFRHVIFKLMLVIDGWGIPCETALIWMSLNFTDDQSTLVQVMAWCHQATSHYLSQCWPRSLSPYGVTRPQWVNAVKLSNETREVLPNEHKFHHFCWQSLQSYVYSPHRQRPPALRDHTIQWSFHCTFVARDATAG